jgi:hypothetical protein
VANLLHFLSSSVDIGETKATDYNLPMDVRVIIVCKTDDGCRVSVVASKALGTVWVKIYKSKDDCLVELGILRLLTAAQVVEVHASDFDKRKVMLIFHSIAKSEALIAANFVEHDPGDNATDTD